MLRGSTAQKAKGTDGVEEYTALYSQLAAMLVMADVVRTLLAGLVGLLLLLSLLSVIRSPSISAAEILLGLSGFLPIAISGMGGIDDGAPSQQLFLKHPFFTSLGLLAPALLYWGVGGTLAGLGFETEVGVLIVVAMFLYKLGQQVDWRLLSVFGYAAPLQAIVSAVVGGLELSSEAFEYALRVLAGTGGMTLCSLGVLSYGAGAGGGAHAYAALVLCFGLLPWQILVSAKLAEAPVDTLLEIALRVGAITLQMTLHFNPVLPCLPPPVDFGAHLRRSMTAALVYSLPFQTLNSLSIESNLMPIFSFALRAGMLFAATGFFFLIDFGAWSASKGIHPHA